MNALAIVPARGGSKGYPNKNLLELDGMPLWRIAIDQARLAGIPKIIVTTDIPEIMSDRVLMEPDLSFHWRKADLCKDDSRIEDAVYDVLMRFPGSDAFVVLNPTHPFRNVQDIKDCLDDCLSREYPSSTAVREDHCYTRQIGAKLPSLNRQERAPRLLVTGSIYAVRTCAFLEKRSLMIWGNVTRGCQRLVKEPKVDIDSGEDYEIAQVKWGKRCSAENSISRSTTPD